MEGFKNAAPAYAAVPRLVWKLWLSDKEKDTAAGIYYFT